MIYFYLLISGVLFIFSNGNWIFPILAWISPIFLVRYIRKQKPLMGIISAFFIYYIAYLIQWRGMVPLDGSIYFLIILGIAISFYIPYIIDRLLYKKLNGFLSTLILPLAGVIIEFIYVNTNPFGQWGSLVMTQVNNSHLIQIVTITGAHGVTFLVFWFVSFINWMWENHFEFKKLKNGIIIFSSVFIFVLIYGSILINFFVPDSKTVRIALISPKTNVSSKFSDPEMSKINYKIDNLIRLTQNELDQYRNFHSKFKDELFEHTEKEAIAGAKIIVWSECGVWILKEDEDDLLDKCRQICEKYNIYILVSVFNIEMGIEPPYRNMAYFVQPDGNVFEYTKANIVPGDYQQRGDGKTFMVNTSYGKISCLICHDMAFPLYVNKVKDADILLNPADAAQIIKNYHSNITKLRAIEYGINIVNPTQRGLSQVFDYRGNILGRADYLTDSPQIAVSNVPTKGIVTIYSILGEWFVCVDIIAFLILIALIIFKKRSENK